MKKRTIPKTLHGFGVYTCLLWIFPEQTLEYTWVVLSFHNKAPLKIISIFLALFLAWHFYLWRKKELFLEREEEEKEIPKMENIKKTDILDFLYKFDGWPTKEAVEYFNITSITHSNISKKLQESKILVKMPPKNKLVLNKDFTKEEIERALDGEIISKPFSIFRV